MSRGTATRVIKMWLPITVNVLPVEVSAVAEDLDKLFEDHDSDIVVQDTVVNGEKMLVVTIMGRKIDEWFLRGLDRAVIHIPEKPEASPDDSRNGAG